MCDLLQNPANLCPGNIKNKDADVNKDSRVFKHLWCFACI